VGFAKRVTIMQPAVNGGRGLNQIQFQTACTVGDTFDPVITLREGCPHTPAWDFGNGDTATGLSISYASFADAGPHTVTLQIPDIDHWLTGIDVYSDKIVGDFFAAIRPAESLVTIGMGENPNVTGDLATLVGLDSLTTLNVKEHQTLITGDIANLALLPSLITVYIAGCGIHGDIADLASATQILSVDLHSHTGTGPGAVGVYGDIADIATLVNLTTLKLGNTKTTGALEDLAPLTKLNLLMLYEDVNSGDKTGALADLAPMTALRQVYLYGCTLLTGAFAATHPGIWDIDLRNMSWDQAAIDGFLAALYANWSSITEWRPTRLLRLEGNAAPSGVYQDATPPITGLEYIYKLENDPDATGNFVWTVSNA
jgi:hypothetical protein